MSCSVFKKEKNNKKVSKNNTKITITGEVKIHYPYCGGAAPTPEMAKGTDSPMKNAKFYIVKMEDISKKSILSFTTDEAGKFLFKIEKGNYFILSEDKVLSFDEFYNKKSVKESQFMKNRGIQCYKKWYNTPDYKLDTEKNTNIKIIFKSNCDVGMNPCLNYNGPLRP